MVRGIAGLNVLLMGMIGTLTIVIAGILPATFVKLNLDSNTIFEYKYNKVQNILLTLFSFTHDGKKVSEIIAESLIIEKPQSLEFLKDNFAKLIEGKDKCYQLNISNQVLVQSDKVKNGECDLKYFVNSTIALPYNPNRLVEEVKVGIG